MRVVPETLVRGQSEVPRLVIVARKISTSAPICMHLLPGKKKEAKLSSGDAPNSNYLPSSASEKISWQSYEQSGIKATIKPQFGMAKQ